MTFESIFSCSAATELLLTLRRVECIMKRRILVTSPVSLKGGTRTFINFLHSWPPSIFCFLGSVLSVSQLISLQGPCPAFDMYVLLPLLSIGLDPEGQGQIWAFIQQTIITAFRICQALSWGGKSQIFLILPGVLPFLLSTMYKRPLSLLFLIHWHFFPPISACNHSESCWAFQGSAFGDLCQHKSH